MTAWAFSGGWTRTAAAAAAGLVQTAVLFPLEKLVLFREGK